MLRLLLRTAPSVQFTRACVVQVAYHGIAAPLFLGVTVVSVGLTLPGVAVRNFTFFGCASWKKGRALSFASSLSDGIYCGKVFEKVKIFFNGSAWLILTALVLGAGICPGAVPPVGQVNGRMVSPPFRHGPGGLARWPRPCLADALENCNGAGRMRYE